MKKLAIICIVFAISIAFVSQFFALEEKYSDYELIFTETNEQASKYDKDILIAVLDNYNLNFTSAKIGNDFTDIDSSLKSDMLQKMERGIKFQIIKHDTGKKYITSYVYHDGYLIRVKGDINKLTEESYAGYVKISGIGRFDLQFFVFMNR